MEKYNYTLEVGDVVLVVEGGYGFDKRDVGKYVEVIGKGSYFGEDGVMVTAYDKPLETIEYGDVDGVVGYGTFGTKPMILLNTNEEHVVDPEHVAVAKGSKEEVDEALGITRDEYSVNHYDFYYTLTENDIKQGKIKVDAYWVAKQWKTGSRDDSGALWHSLKTIARFGDKNSKEREIKALYNQALALARIYSVEL